MKKSKKIVMPPDVRIRIYRHLIRTYRTDCIFMCIVIDRWVQEHQRLIPPEVVLAWDNLYRYNHTQPLEMFPEIWEQRYDDSTKNTRRRMSEIWWGIDDSFNRLRISKNAYNKLKNRVK